MKPQTYTESGTVNTLTDRKQIEPDTQTHKWTEKRENIVRQMDS